MDPELNTPKLNIRGKEKLALASIDNCIRKRLRRHAKYKRAGLAQKNAGEIPCISNPVHEFWNECISKFETEVVGLFFSPDVKLRKNNNPGTNSKLVESVSGESSCEIQSVEDKKCSDDDGAVWITPLDEFARAYDKLIHYYYGSSNRMFKLFNELKAPNKLDWLETLDELDELDELAWLDGWNELDGFVDLDELDGANLFGELDELARLDGVDGVDGLAELARLDGWDELARLGKFARLDRVDRLDELARLDKMFLDLCSKIWYYDNRKTKNDSLNGSILGNADFKCLPFMLNLQEKNVRKLLPYLLTAYTFNSCDSRFFTRIRKRSRKRIRWSGRN